MSAVADFPLKPVLSLNNIIKILLAVSPAVSAIDALPMQYQDKRLNFSFSQHHAAETVLCVTSRITSGTTCLLCLVCSDNCWGAENSLLQTLGGMDTNWAEPVTFLLNPTSTRLPVLPVICTTIKSSIYLRSLHHRQHQKRSCSPSSPALCALLLLPAALSCALLCATSSLTWPFTEPCNKHVRK